MNYRESDDEVKKAWFLYRDNYSSAGVPSLASFVAGWNACKLGGVTSMLLDFLGKE